MNRTSVIGAGIAGWSIRHPVGVVMITLALAVLGLFALGSLHIDLLPKITYPEVRVRVIDPGVPATIMEDEVTRQLEEQLAITEDAIHVQSTTREGRSAVNLSFSYGKDIDEALRDASTRLDRAKRFLPETIEPPTIYKRDPSQLPVAEYVVSSALRNPVALRDWVDYSLGKWLLAVPGLAAVEVGGGLQREIHIVADQDRLAGLGLDVLDIQEVLTRENQDVPGGRLLMRDREIAGRTAGRFDTLSDIQRLPLSNIDADQQTRRIRLQEVAQIIDGAEDERLTVRFNDLSGIKVSLQKQPGANTVSVVDGVARELQMLQEKGLIPDDVAVTRVNDEALFIRQSLNNAAQAAASGALLAMTVVYLFLGSVKRTLIIGSAIPIAILVTIVLMAVGGLTLNTMTLGGLALGVGMLVDSTIVMLENIYRHQRDGHSAAPVRAAAEVNSAIVASTTTNLAAVLPFLFIGGLIGLLFRELIFTISAAILASMVVALTLVPSLAGRVSTPQGSRHRRRADTLLTQLQNGYTWLLRHCLGAAWVVLLTFAVLGATIGLPFIAELTKPPKQFIPKPDDGRISVRLTADRGINVAAMDQITRRVETIVKAQPEVLSTFTTVGGYVFGRSTFESPNRAGIDVQLAPKAQHGISSRAWIKRMTHLIDELQLVGVRVGMYVRGIRGLRLSRGDDDLTFHVQGPDLPTLETIATAMVEALQQVPGLGNLQHSNDLVNQELSVRVDRERAADYGLSVEDVGRAVQFALEGKAVTQFIDNDRSIDIVLRLNREDIANPADVGDIILFSRKDPRGPLRLSSIASTHIEPMPVNIHRDRQQRIVKVEASLTEGYGQLDVIERSLAALAQVELPNGYFIYEAGNLEALKSGRDLTWLLLGLAAFLVLVVMSVQYESLRNPLIIVCSLVFSVIGVALGLEWTDTAISMPVWLGMIMLTGIVVNNAIVLVEYIEIEKRRGKAKVDAVIAAAGLRLRPILMTTLTTVVGMLPLAMALGGGAEMLQPLAITIISGLLFSTLVSLLLVPAIYYYAGAKAPGTLAHYTP